MKSELINDLLKIGEYVESLETRMAGMEARVAALQAKVIEAQMAEDQQVTLIASLEARIAELEALKNTPAMSVVQENLPDEQEEDDFEDLDEDEELEEIELEDDVEEEEETVELPVIEEKPVQQVAPSAPVAPAQPAAKPQKFGSHVDDIRKAISLGDQFLFQRELFSQNGELMQKTLDQLNQCASFDEANEYLSGHFAWDRESTAYELFTNVLHRRFS